MTNWLTVGSWCLVVVLTVTSAAGASEQSSSLHRRSTKSFYPINAVVEHTEDGSDNIDCKDAVDCEPEADLPLDLDVSGSGKDSDDDRSRQERQSVAGNDRWRRDVGLVRSWNVEPYELAVPLDASLRHLSPVRVAHLRRRPVRQEPHLVIASGGRMAASAPLRQRWLCPDDDNIDGQPDTAQRSVSRHHNNGNERQANSLPRSFRLTTFEITKSLSSSSSTITPGGCIQKNRSTPAPLASSWSKRPRLRYYRDGDGPKRNWRTNMMRVWGKRSRDSYGGS